MIIELSFITLMYSTNLLTVTSLYSVKQISLEDKYSFISFSDVSFWLYVLQKGDVFLFLSLLLYQLYCQKACVSQATSFQVNQT